MAQAWYFRSRSGAERGDPVDPIVGWATWLMRPIAIDRAAGQPAVNQVVQQVGSD